MARKRERNPDSISSSYRPKSFASIASDIDLLDDSTGISGECKAIRCQTAGTLVITLADGTTTETLYFLAGETQDVVASKLVAAGSSGCVPITVYG